MASRSSKRRLPAEKKSPPAAKKGRVKTQTAQLQEDEVPHSPSLLKKPVGRPKGSTMQSKKRAASPALNTPTKAPCKTSTPRAPRGKKKVAQEQSTVTGMVPDTDSPNTLRRRLIKILKDSDAAEKLLPAPKQDLLPIDSDDELDEGGAKVPQQETMQGRRPYTDHPNSKISEEEQEGEEDLAMDLSVSSTKLRQSIQDTSVFDDPTKSNLDWWKEDPTRELTLVKLWKEEESLYNFSSKSHMSEDRPSILKRFSTILRVPPHVIDTKMQSMRNMYQSLFRQCKSGSEPVGRTERQKEVQHGTEEDDGDQDLNLSGILDRSLTPMKPPGDVSPFTDNSNSEDEFVPSTKHFSRNDRLHDPKYSQVAAKQTEKESSNNVGKERNTISQKAKGGPRKGSSFSASTNPKIRTDNTGVMSKKNQIRVQAEIHASADGTHSRVTEKSVGADVIFKKNSTAEERAAAYKELKAQDLANKEDKSKTKTTAAQRRLLMSSSVNDKDHAKEYATAIDAAWYDKQGPGYRKQVENDRKKKEKDRDEKFAQLMAEKNENLKKLTEGLTSGASTSSSGVLEVCPEQLWADSMVPKLKRMSEEVKDDFMVHVLSLSVKAIRGEWP